MTISTIELVTIFSDVSKQAENYSISLYDQLIQEGVEKGIEAGIDQTNRKAIRAMLTLNMEKAMIATLSNLTPVNYNPAQPMSQGLRYTAKTL
ncbi:hypothetical protein JYG30_04875 [Fibrella sp. USSR17]